MTFEEWLDKNEDEYAGVYRQYAEEVENPEPLIEFLENEWRKTIDNDEVELTEPQTCTLQYYDVEDSIDEFIEVSVAKPDPDIIGITVVEETPELPDGNFEMVYVDAESVDTGSHLSLYREYAEEEMANGNENFKTFSEFRNDMNA